MNRITFLFFCLFLCVFQTEASDGQERQRITIRFKNQSLDSALCQLEKQSSLSFHYQDSIVDKPNKISRNFKDKTISQVLEVLLANTNCAYIINDSISVIIYKKVGDSSKTGQAQESIPLSITGKVLDDGGRFAWGVSIYIISEHDKYISKENFVYNTNNDGSFVISTTPPNIYFVLMYLGHIPRVVHIKDAELIKLEPDVKLLNEVWRVGQN